MKRKIVYLIILLVIIGGAAAFFIINRQRRASGPSSVRLNQPEFNVLVTAPGLVEPISEEVKVGSSIGGKLKAVLVDEGDQVQRGQTIAILENDDNRAQVASAEARLRQAEAELRQVIAGARDQERREALAAVEEAEIVLNHARTEMERRQDLYRTGDIPREEIDRAVRDYRAANARYEAVKQRYAIVNAKAREEERAKAEANVAQARAQLNEARARLEKTFIHSPITGIVLRKHLKPGESVIDLPGVPIVTVADVTTLRVRVDVDEKDVGKLEVGQRAYVTADAYGDKKFWGRVVRIGQALGRKNIRTDEPTERIDTKILETLVELDEGQMLPTGLRVYAYIVGNGSSVAIPISTESRLN